MNDREWQFDRDNDGMLNDPLHIELRGVVRLNVLVAVTSLLMMTLIALNLLCLLAVRMSLFDCH